jgi:hypothetical protein
MAPHENAQIAEHCERFKCELPQPHLHWQILLLLHYDKERSQRPKVQEVVLMSMEVKHPDNRNRKPTGKPGAFKKRKKTHKER